MYDAAVCTTIRPNTLVVVVVQHLSPAREVYVLLSPGCDKERVLAKTLRSSSWEDREDLVSLRYNLPSL